ncbi:MAG: amidohydrolase family protein [Burkholderiaceae bacterium]
MTPDARSTNTLISGCRLVDGTGRSPIENGAILVSGDRIALVGRTQDVRARADRLGPFEVIDGTGKTVIPGMIDSHAHIAFFKPRSSLEIDGVWPAQYLGILARHNAQRMLGAGFTGAVGGGSQFTVEVWVKRAIRAGLFRGPRILASSRALTPSGGDGDWHPSWLRMEKMDGLAAIADGPWEVIKVARKLLKEGPDTLKIYPSGENSRVEAFHPQMYDCPAERDCMTAEEIEAAVGEAHRWGKMVVAHARGDGAVRTCVRTGVEIILHATLATDETIAMMAERPPLGVVPALMPNKQFVEAGRAGRINPAYFHATHYEQEWESARANVIKMRKAGIRIVPGGEYGLSESYFHGHNAMDLELFVNDLGFTPLEAISAATRDASYLMKMEDKIGTLEEGKLADLVLVDGDPLADIRVLQDLAKIEMVMKDGEVQARHGKVMSV